MWLYELSGLEIKGNRFRNQARTQTVAQDEKSWEIEPRWK